MFNLLHYIPIIYILHKSYILIHWELPGVVRFNLAGRECCAPEPDLLQELPGGVAFVDWMGAYFILFSYLGVQLSL